MRRALFGLAAGLGLAALTAGCAGGWRNGEPPGSAVESARQGAAPSSVPTAGAQRVTFVWKGGGNQVSLGGEFNQWSATADPMAKQADSTWSIAKDLAPGRYAYKFVIDGTWKEDPASSETVDDGMGGKNSVLVVGGATPSSAPGSGAGTPNLAASPSAPSTPGAAGKAPEVVADGIRFTFAGAAQSVSLAGDFNAWAINTDPMSKQPDGTWTLVKKLAPGTYAYKFFLNATTWKPDEANPESRDDGFGGKNSIVTVK